MSELPAQLHQLKEVYFYRLILIVVPEGDENFPWLVDWARRLSETGLGKVAWIALGSSNREPLPFWICLVKALQSAGIQSGDSLDSEKDQSEAFCLDMFIEDLINDLAEETEDVFLIFENYHRIDNPETHAAIQLLLDYLPDRAHIVIVTQKKLPLQLSRFRVRRQMIEIHVDKSAN